VLAGGTLGGSGTVGGATTISGTHSPGNSPGIQTFADGLSYLNGSTFVWELTANDTTGRGSIFDGVNVTGGTLTINSGVTSSLVFNGDGSSVLWGNSFWDTDRSWLVFSNASVPTTSLGIFSIITSLDSSGAAFATARPVSTFTWSTVGNDVYLNYVVPEPSTYALLVLSAAGLAAHVIRRRRRHN